jgi:hypothetical protein
MARIVIYHSALLAGRHCSVRNIIGWSRVLLIVSPRDLTLQAFAAQDTG